MSSGASNAGSNLGQKVKGAFETAHGLGETVRGGTLDFIDSAVGHGKRHNATDRGAQETEEGIARMEHGKAGANATTPVPQPGQTADNSTHPGAPGNEKPHGGVTSALHGAGYGPSMGTGTTNNVAGGAGATNNVASGGAGYGSSTGTSAGANTGTNSGTAV
ncbi:hypothetical protein EUX98_g5585 [Antrodiella citrinella]|uniref:CsbD-like domain-containing protein n=1 Tax=Antrodiella citrinella TaxID=2447956 RepID=A0A4S4MTZ3_9APHY|nr:hypothetical protein EUX98_g5585 [Antrodiella citrinella]